MKIKSEIEIIQKKHKDAPTLVVVLVGENPASLSYVRGKERACLKAGINCLIYKYDKNVSEKELQKVLQKFSGGETKLNLSLNRHTDIIMIL